MHLMLHAFQLVERAHAVEWLHRAAGNRETLLISLSVGRHCIVTPHRVFNSIRLDIAGCRQDGRHRNAIRLHNSHTVVVVSILPARFLLKASAGQRTEMVMNVEDLHEGSSERFMPRLVGASQNWRQRKDPMVSSSVSSSRKRISSRKLFIELDD